jgi:acetylglutamate kinase
MKLVVKLSRSVTDKQEYLADFARATASLCHDHHQTVVIHGVSEAAHASGNGNGSAHILSADKTMELECESRCLVTSLVKAGIPGLGLHGSDAGICHVRKKHFGSNGASEFKVEPSCVNPQWLDIICRNGGVPVVSNLVVAGWGQAYLVNSDSIAAECAIAWKADALIYIADFPGLKDIQGFIARWVHVDDIEQLAKDSTMDNDGLQKAKVCRKALKQGVGRTRILPVWSIAMLPLFFSSRIEWGTEVISVPRTNKPGLVMCNRAPGL